MFIYESGMPVGYQVSGNYPDDIARQIEAHMLEWFRNLPGQARVRLGKVGIMQGSQPNLKRLDNE